ncbi:unnamed protein product [Schistosoma margrebowiei]|uniref:Uncharacterized protein n=1 Tax=Schistosoma margrebowiei TaxID=48269 RepID=A0A183MDS8_9TREM|nr:unnamed protein product [Schistosoma margrebowiei]
MATITLNIFRPTSQTLTNTPSTTTTTATSTTIDAVSSCIFNKNDDTMIVNGTLNKYICFVKDLPQLARNVHQLAIQLYVHRFKFPYENIINQLQKCPICSENILLFVCSLLY